VSATNDVADGATAPGSDSVGPLDKAAAVERFYAVLGQVIGVDPVPPGDHFLDTGADSLDAVIVTDMLAEEFGTGPELDWYFESASVQELADQWWRQLADSKTLSPT